jgi:hypothetical protein
MINTIKMKTIITISARMTATTATIGIKAIKTIRPRIHKQISPNNANDNFALVAVSISSSVEVIPFFLIPYEVKGE